MKSSDVPYRRVQLDDDHEVWDESNDHDAPPAPRKASDQTTRLRASVVDKFPRPGSTASTTRLEVPDMSRPWWVVATVVVGIGAAVFWGLAFLL